MLGNSFTICKHKLPRLQVTSAYLPFWCIELVIDGADNCSIIVKCDTNGWECALFSHVADNRLGFSFASVDIVRKHAPLPLRFNQFAYGHFATIGKRDKFAIAETFIYNIELVPPPNAQKPDVFTKVANVVHPGIGSGIDLNDIRRMARGNLEAGQAFITGLTILWTSTIDRLGKQTGGAGLTGSSRPTEEVGMDQSVISHGVPQRPSHSLLTD